MGWVSSLDGGPVCDGCDFVKPKDSCSSLDDVCSIRLGIGVAHGRWRGYYADRTGVPIWLCRECMEKVLGEPVLALGFSLGENSMTWMPISTKIPIDDFENVKEKDILEMLLKERQEDSNGGAKEKK